MQGYMWRRMGMVAVGGLLLALGVGCNAAGKLASNSDLSGGLWTVALNSSAFREMEAIPEKYTADGMNISPPLKWSKGPSGLKEWAIIVQDVDETTKDGYPVTNWSIFRIPGNVNELPEGASKSISYPQGKNYKGENGYYGPFAKPGKKHKIYFQIFALDEPQDITAGADRATIRKVFKGHVLSKGVLTGTFTGPEEKK